MLSDKANNSSLKQKAISGVVWTSIQRFSQIFVSFFSSIILARLLEPEDYGCIGLLSIFMLLSATFIDGGFGAALIQKKRPSKDDYSTVFFWNFGLSVIIYIVLFFIAPLIAYFYKTPLLCGVLRVQGIVLIINALQTVQLNQLYKQFKFRKISITLTLASIISIVITIGLAYKGMGVWSLVAQNLLLAFIPTFVFWTTNKWYPKIVFSIQSFKELFGFGFYMLLTSLVTTIANNIQGLLIGRIYNPSLMGYYSKAHSTEKLASSTLSQMISQVTYPLYSELQEDKILIASVIKKITSSIAFLVFPLMFLLILLARPIYIILYSEKWIKSIPYFQMLCLAGIAICLQSANAQTIAAIGKSKEMFKWGVFKQLVGIVFVVLGLLLNGINGMLIGMVLKSWLIYFVNAFLVSIYIGYSLWSQVKDLTPILGTSIFAFLLAYIAGYLGGYCIYLKGLAELIVFLGIYVFISFAIKQEGMKNVKEIIQLYLHRFFKKNNKNDI